jgi:hypothetical protein
VPNPIFSIHRLRHSTLRGTSSFRLIRGLGPVSVRDRLRRTASSQWPRSSQECASVEARGVIGTVFRSYTAVRPDHSEAFASCSRFQFWAASITSSFATGLGCVSFLSWICAGAACGKLLSCAPTKELDDHRSTRGLEVRCFSFR